MKADSRYGVFFVVLMTPLQSEGMPTVHVCVADARGRGTLSFEQASGRLLGSAFGGFRFGT